MNDSASDATTPEDDIRAQLREMMGENWRDVADEPVESAPVGRAGMLSRGAELGDCATAVAPRLEDAPTAPTEQPNHKFFPTSPTSLEATGLRASDIESLVLKMMLRQQSLAAHKIALRAALPPIRAGRAGRRGGQAVAGEAKGL